MLRALCLTWLCCNLVFGAYAQSAVVQGTITDSTALPLENVSIQLLNTVRGTVSDAQGRYRLLIPSDTVVTIEFRYLGFAARVEQLELADGQIMELNVVLRENTAVLSDVVIRDSELRNEAGLTVIDPKTVQTLPSAFGDFNRILLTLPGVVNNNELSSAYSVRGGNFDENLVYVNDIPVYRPFLVTNGQQEGLSFINPDLVSAVRFSSGGWQPKYGDKLASVLNVQYKQPKSFGASASVSLLGATGHVEGVVGGGRVSYVAGVRHKSSQYLLNTLETTGGYRPRFTDAQVYTTIRMSKRPRVRAPLLGVMLAYARNRYQVVPERRTTEFGTFNQPLRFTVAFAGREVLEYDTYQAGLKYTSWIKSNWKSDLIFSVVRAFEREYTNVEGGYRLCDVDKQTGSPTFNECVVTRGIGTEFTYGRNSLESVLINAESRHAIILDDKNEVHAGIGINYQSYNDILNEYEFTDSLGFVANLDNRGAEVDFTNYQLGVYAQYHWKPSLAFSLVGGMRGTYIQNSGQFLLSPRVQASVKPRWKRDIIFKGSMGLYHQPPFYREFRDQEGVFQDDVKAQSSFHAILGMDYGFQWWGRDFNFIVESYYKYMWNVNPYDVDNVKIRYYANNDAVAYATGIDFRVSGEFIEGTQSWFSVGFLKTMEDLEGDGRGYIRRPTDQRVNVAIQFQDHFPNDPKSRVNLAVLFGSGLPFGPPNDLENRNVFDGDSYRRVDIGFSRLFYLEKNSTRKQLLVTAEILNLLGSDNPISYLFVSDTNGNQFAVPNSLSARFFNIRVAFMLF